jgi:hypothetical protein
MKRERTDLHRKGAIIPADYSHVMSYNLSTSYQGEPIPSFGVNCELDRQVVNPDKTIQAGKHDADGRCCIVGMRSSGKTFAAHGGTGKCSVCGAAFVYGDVWEHTPSGELIHVGHDCAAKYELLADRSAHEMALGRLRSAAAVEIIRARNAALRSEFLAAHPGLEDALKMDHKILRDLAERFRLYCSMSEKQVALAFKLADEIRNPKPEEAHVPAPVSEGRLTIRGSVVSTKVQETDFGSILRMTVKVQTPAGSWLAWGTCPRSIASFPWKDGVSGQVIGTTGISVGDQVEFTATLRAGGREDFFAFFSRPTNARIIEMVPDADEVRKSATMIAKLAGGSSLVSALVASATA